MGEDQQKYISGATLEVKNLGDGNFQVTQLSQESRLPPVKGIKGRHEFSWSFGPAKITGYIETSTMEIGVTASIVGIDLGTFYGNLKDGLVIKINLAVVKGEIRFYLKNGNELWVHLEAKVLFDGEYNKDHLLISF